ncbi:MAG: hypothetical protein AAF492_13830 [Verrucomicrobiota bacterium]
MAHSAFRIAGLDFMLGAALRNGDLPEPYRPFRISPEGVTDRCGTYTAIDFCAPRVSFMRGDALWRCETWRIGYADDGKLALDLHSVAHEDWFTVALLQPDFSSGFLYPLNGRNGARAEYPLNYPYDQAILMNRLSWLSAGVVHACGVEIDGRAWLFCGRSDVGKTTMGRRWRRHGGTLLNDDRMVLRLMGGEVFAAPSPWPGEERTVINRMLPLGGIFHLRQGDWNRIEDLSVPEALARLVATSVAPFWFAEGMGRLLDTWAAVVERVPAYVLTSCPDDRVIQTIRDVLKEP